MKNALILIIAFSIAGAASAKTPSKSAGSFKRAQLTASQWNRKLQSLPKGIPLPEIQRIIRPKRMHVNRVYTSSGGSADLILDNRYSAAVAFAPDTQRMIWIAPVERIRK